MDRVEVVGELLYFWECPDCGEVMELAESVESGCTVTCDWCEAKFKAVEG